LAVHVPDLQVTGTDISLAALEVARSNAWKHNVADRVNLKYTDLLAFRSPVASFDLICANLPYIPRKTLEELEVFGREPTLALDGGPDGLRLIHRLLPQAARRLNSKGLLLLEIEATLGESGMNLARANFPGSRVDLLSDLAGHDRLIRVEIL
jgi:HemK-like putative methylase